MVTSAEPQLFDYGILQEDSDIRVHVGVIVRRVYVFETKKARSLIEQNPHKYPIKLADQPGVIGATGKGWVVPWTEIPGIRQLLYDSFAWESFGALQNQYSTQKKGSMAVACVVQLMKMGRLPIWINDTGESDNEKIQITGTDIVVFCKKKIQVKCDWRCGDKGRGGTGNVFLQNAELNPLKMH